MKLFFYKNELKWTNLSAEVCVRVSFSFFKEFFLQILSCSASKYLLARQYILRHIFLHLFCYFMLFLTLVMVLIIFSNKSILRISRILSFFLVPLRYQELQFFLVLPLYL